MNCVLSVLRDPKPWYLDKEYRYARGRCTSMSIFGNIVLRSRVLMVLHCAVDKNVAGRVY